MARPAHPVRPIHRRGARTLAVALAAVAAALAAPTASSAQAAPPEGGSPVALQQIVAPGGIDLPTAMAARTGQDDLFVAERPGRIRMIDGQTDQLVDDPLLDVTGYVGTQGEGGLLGLAFDPAGTRVYVHYTNVQGNLRLVEYRVTGTTDTTLVPGSRRVVLKIRHQPYRTNYGGDIAFGPDGKLYIAVGDGGGAGDPDGNGQNRQVLLGKVLRIDPTATATRPYRIPPSNPFVGQSPRRGEIWLYGVRNPSSISFDSQTGDLVVADTGQAAWEEVNVLPNTGPNPRGRGANLGWSRMEGTQTFNGTEPTGHVPPTFAYEHLDAPDPAPTPGHIAGCSIVGGGVYRGTLLPSLTGRYVFGDACTGTMSAVLPDGSSPVTDLATIYHSDIWNDPVESCVVILTFDEDDDSLVIGGGDGSVSRVVAAP